MGKEEQYRELELNANIDSYYPSHRSYSKIEGSRRRVTMSGCVDDRLHGPLSNHEGIRNSDFSRAPITINIYFDSSDKQLENGMGVNAFGNIEIRQNVEVTHFELEGNPINVWIVLPLESFIAVEETLKTNVQNGKLGYVNLGLRVTRNQMKEDFAKWDEKYYYPSLSDLDTSKEGLAMGVFDFSFGSTIFDNVERNVKRVKTLCSDGDSSSLSIVMQYYHWSFNTQAGNYDRIHIDGIAHKKPSEKIDVSIALHQFNWFSDPWSGDDLPIESIYGNYYYSPKYGLSIELAYHPTDFDDQIKPLLCSGGSQTVLFTVQFDEVLNFDTDQRGKVRTFCVEALYEQIHQKNYEQDLIAKLANIETKICEVEARICENEMKNKRKIDLLFKNIAAIKTQTDVPNDVLSKIAFKIPIIGSILRFLSR